MKNRKNSNPRRAYLWVLIIVLLAAIPCGVFAKYIQQREQKIVAQAKTFYFSSDLLMEAGASYNLNPGTTQVEFSLRNYADEFRSAEDEITYDVYVNGEHVEDGTLNWLDTEDTITIDVEAGKTYRVQAIGEAGYRKELSAIFTVEPPAEGFFKHLDTPDAHYVLLTVWAQDISGDVVVSFPAGLIPDATDEKLASVYNYADGHYVAGSTNPVQLEEYGSVVYRFFKEDTSATYSVEDFTVVMGEKTAVVGTP